MGLFDRFKSAGGKTGGTADTSRQDALRLIDQGNAIEEEGRLEEAMQHYEAAIRIAPALPRAHLNRGNVLLASGDFDGALAAYATALQHDPNYAGAWFNTGNARLFSGRHEAALEAYTKAVALKPDFVDAEVARGNVLEDLGQLEAAAASYRRALALHPDYAEVHNNLGNVLNDLGQFEAAADSYRRALQLKPDYADAHSGLGNVFKDLGELAGAVASYRRALELKPDFVSAFSGLLFCHNYLSDQPAAALLAEAKRYGASVAQPANAGANWPNSPEPERGLRVGFVSGDLRNHPVGYFVESVLTALSAGAGDRVALFAYSNNFRNDPTSERIKASCRGWRQVIGMPDQALAQSIRDDRIDILIDLSGHTAHNRLPLFAWKPAPVQASWLGYFATTGVEAIDYLIADSWTLPQSEEKNFTEKIWRLPETRLCFTAPEHDVPPGPLPALDKGHVTFGCFNNLTKMNDEVVALWARVLAAVPRSRLSLMAQQLADPTVRQRVAQRFAAHGIDASRLVLQGPVARADYLRAYHEIDIALDPFPYPGGTTTVEALWMAVPVLTLAGSSFLSRQGVGFLMNAGLPEWIATSGEDYIARAVTHAADLPRLASLRNGLRAQLLASPIFDAPRFAAHFEAALRGMWRAWCERQ